MKKKTVCIILLLTYNAHSANKNYKKDTHWWAWVAAILMATSRGN